MYEFTDYLEHHGVLGMKWGVRRYQNKDGTLTDKGKKKYYENDTIVTKAKNGDILYAYRQKPQGLAKLLSKNKSIAKEQNKTFVYDIYTKGKRVGETELYKESKTSMNGVWLGIKKIERGKGYASAILDGSLKFAKANNFKQFTLEVPGNSPDARHIYDKKGFKPTKQLTKPEDDIVWGGLTAMKKKL